MTTFVCVHCSKSYEADQPAALSAYSCAAGGYCEAQSDRAPSSLAGMFGDDDGDDLLQLEREALGLAGRRGWLRPAPPPVFDVEGLLTFERSSTNPRIFEASPQRSFKPRGLLLWDVGTLSIEAATIGRDHQLVQSWPAIPARFFATALSFEQLQQMAREGREPSGAWGSWHAAHPGMLVRLVFDGDASAVQACMWGHTIR